MKRLSTNLHASYGGVVVLAKTAIRNAKNVNCIAGISRVSYTEGGCDTSKEAVQIFRKLSNIMSFVLEIIRKTFSKDMTKVFGLKCVKVFVHIEQHATKTSINVSRTIPFLLYSMSVS